MFQNIRIMNKGTTVSQFVYQLNSFWIYRWKGFPQQHFFFLRMHLQEMPWQFCHKVFTKNTGKFLVPFPFVCVSCLGYYNWATSLSQRNYFISSIFWWSWLKKVRWSWLRKVTLRILVFDIRGNILATITCTSRKKVWVLICIIDWREGFIRIYQNESFSGVAAWFACLSPVNKPQYTV